MSSKNRRPGKPGTPAGVHHSVPRDQRGRATRAEALAQLRRAQAREQRRSRLLVAGGIVVAVAIIAAALVTIGLRHGPSAGSASTSNADTSVVDAVTGVPRATFDQVGAGAAQAFPNPIKAPALTADGKPRVLYVGAEYCPFCAAERWAVVAALARFGTLTDLGQTASAGDDVFPDTPTLSFHGARYTSKYLSFTGVETSSNQRQGNGYAPLDTLSAPDRELLSTYNAPPYVSGQGGSIPFVDLGGKFVSSGASFSPQVLAGKTHAEVARALADPDSDIAQAVDGTANVFTAALCRITGNEPGSVCTSPGVKAAATKLGNR